MKKWNSPDVWFLGAKYTECGARVGEPDGIKITDGNLHMIGRSGPMPDGWEVDPE